ncbi:hypothetical protein MRX96_035836, partial [Rhipicephalus microplus]
THQIDRRRDYCCSLRRIERDREEEEVAKKMDDSAHGSGINSDT